MRRLDLKWLCFFTCEKKKEHRQTTNNNENKLRLPVSKFENLLSIIFYDWVEIVGLPVDGRTKDIIDLTSNTKNFEIERAIFY